MDERIAPFTKKLDKTKMESFCKALEFCDKYWVSEDDHEVLLYYHIIEIKEACQLKLFKRQKTYSISMTPAQTIAMLQIIGKFSLDYLRLEGLILQEIANDIDQYKKSISIHS